MKIGDNDFNGLSDRIDFAHAVKNYVNGRDTYFPHAVDGEKVAHYVKVFSTKGLGEVDALQSAIQVDYLQEELSTHLLQTAYFLLDERQVLLRERGLHYGCLEARPNARLLGDGVELAVEKISFAKD